LEQGDLGLWEGARGEVRLLWARPDGCAARWRCA